MARHNNHIDRFFLISVMTLVIAGFVVFLSASLGLLAQNNISFEAVAMKQGISLIIGLIAFFFFSKVKYNIIRKLSLFIFIGAIIVNLLLFIPSIAIFHGGASRWIDLGFISFQPSEFLKIAFIIYMAAWIHAIKEDIKSARYGLLPYAVIMAILSVILLAQSDTDTLVVIGVTGLIMLIIAGVPWRQMFLAGMILVVVVIGVVIFRPYAMQRVKTFLHLNTEQSQSANYQINQSLIAIGSGQILGRGFGQSIQKFGYLPQPTDDSIFAVGAEEFGFVGSIVLILLYISFAMSSLRIATRSHDLFGGFVASGIATLIIIESFMNMSSMLGLIPLSGMPLLFVSHGGTALIIVLASSGIIANISRTMRTV